MSYDFEQSAAHNHDLDKYEEALDRIEQLEFGIDGLNCMVAELKNENARLAAMIIGLRGEKEAYALLGEEYRPDQTKNKTEKNQ